MPVKISTRTLVGIALVALLLSVPSTAETNHRIPLRIKYEGDDLVGKTFIYDLKNELSRSSVFQYNPDSDGDGWGLDIVSTSAEPGNNHANQSGISVVLLLKFKNQIPTTFMGHWVIIIGPERTQKMAKITLVEVDHVVDEFHKLAP